jgi:hypothetical protein
MEWPVTPEVAGSSPVAPVLSIALPVRDRGHLAGKPGRGELADQPADRAPRQTRPGDELGSRLRPAQMQLAHDGAEVGTPDRLAALAERIGRGGHVICDPLAQIVVIRSYMKVALSNRLGFATVVTSGHPLDRETHRR